MNAEERASDATSLVGNRLKAEGQLGRLRGGLVLSLCLGRQVHANVLHQPLLRFRTCQGNHIKSVSCHEAQDGILATLTFALHGPLLVDHRLGNLLELAVERLVLLALQAKARGVTRGPEADEGENAKGRTLEFCIS